jgi:polyphosphate kinase
MPPDHLAGHQSVTHRSPRNRDHRLVSLTAQERGAAEGARLLNRELSWLDWNARVLELAEDPDEPLLDRVRFCAIFSSNLDEFFMVRVAGLLDQVASGLVVRSDDERSAQETLREIRTRVLELTARQSRLWSSSLQPALAQQGILVGRTDDCTEEELAELQTRFDRDIYPVLTPLAVGPGQPFPYISGLSLSLGLLVRDPVSGEERFARVKIPEGLARFHPIGERGLRIPLEHVIAHHLPRLFPGMELADRMVFRVTRDADFSVSDEADDLLEAVESEVRRRRFGDVVRVEISSSTTRSLLARLEGYLGTTEHVYPIRALLDLADLMELAGLDRPDLKYEPRVPFTPARLSAPTGGNLFDEIRQGDILVQHPYDSFGNSVEAFVRLAAKDPSVVALKTTIYRTSHESAVAPSLIEAAEEGKQSVALVELKARFDERRNIEWSRRLEQAGVHVVFGFPHLKIHAKATLVLRQEADRLQRYVHLATGNYNAVTARLYEDVGLFTVDADIAADVAELFNYVTGFARPSKFRKLLVAPLNVRSGLTELIRSTARVAQRGEPARIRIKVNNLSDPSIAEELYRASQAGVQVDLIVRSVCTLRPGVEGLSDSIRVRCVAGQVLEHSRLFHFEAGERTTYLLGSADLMPRNLDHRIEIVAPIEDARAQAELNAILSTLLADNTHAWELRGDGLWRRIRPKKSERRQTAQLKLTQRRRRVRRVSEPDRSG